MLLEERRGPLLVFRHRPMGGNPFHISVLGRDRVLLGTVSAISSWRNGTESVVVMCSISIRLSPFNDMWIRITRMEWESQSHSLKGYDAGARRKVCWHAAHMLRDSKARIFIGSRRMMGEPWANRITFVRGRIAMPDWEDKWSYAQS
jgi:hypothetical protein